MSANDAARLVQLSLARSLAVIVAAEEELARIDAAAGDGDHGAGMVRGFRAATAAADAGGETASQILMQAGAAFADAAAGASGVLIGTLLTTIGQTLPDDSIDAAALHRALQAGLDAIERLGKAKPGDKTMIDTLDPFIHAFGEAAGNGATTSEAWRRALPAAEQGARSTAEMISRRGRSSRLGERSRGHVDPGAMSMLYVLQAVGEVLAQRPPLSNT